MDQRGRHVDDKMTSYEVVGYVAEMTCFAPSGNLKPLSRWMNESATSVLAVGRINPRAGWELPEFGGLNPQFMSTDAHF